MKKITRTKQPDEVEYGGNSIRIGYVEVWDEVSIWVTNRGQMPSYGRIDLNMKALKELAQILPEFIKEVEKEV